MNESIQFGLSGTVNALREKREQDRKSYTVLALQFQDFETLEDSEEYFTQRGEVEEAERYAGYQLPVAI